MSSLIIKISLLFNYILPNAFISSYGRNIYYLNRSIYNLILIIFTFFILQSKKFILKKREIILIIFVFFRIIIVKDMQSAALLSLILIDRITFKVKINKNLILLSILFCFLYSSYFYKFHGRPMSTSIGEINQSGFSLFILYLLCQKNKFKILRIITLFMGIFTYSRNFLLAVIVEKIIKKIKILQELISVMKLNNFLVLTFLTFILMHGIGIGFEKYVKNFGVNKYQKGFARYTTLVDNSNLYRFQANNNAIRYYKYNSKKLVTGTTLNEFKQELKENTKKYNVEIKSVRDPHNFFYKYLLKYGIFSFFLFYYVGKILKQISNRNLGIFYGFYIYSIFLGVGFYDFYLLILKYLIDENNK